MKFLSVRESKSIKVKNQRKQCEPMGSLKLLNNSRHDNHVIRKGRLFNEISEIAVIT